MCLLYFTLKSTIVYDAIDNRHPLSDPTEFLKRQIPYPELFTNKFNYLTTRMKNIMLGLISELNPLRFCLQGMSQAVDTWTYCRYRKPYCMSYAASSYRSSQTCTLKIEKKQIALSLQVFWTCSSAVHPTPTTSLVVIRLQYRRLI